MRRGWGRRTVASLKEQLTGANAEADRAARESNLAQAARSRKVGRVAFSTARALASPCRPISRVSGSIFHGVSDRAADIGSCCWRSFDSGVGIS